MKHLKAKVNQIWNDSLKKDRICMHNGCENSAIRSHVFQKNGILKGMSVENHLIQLEPNNIFDFENNGTMKFKKKGINNAYTFKGFCNEHDNQLFKLIENPDNINLFDKRQQILFSYRGLCQEIRRKEVAKECISKVSKEFPIEAYHFANDLIGGYSHGIRNLYHFKEKIDTSLNSNDLSKFYFKTIEIPKIELCISVPLSVGEFKNEDNLNHEDWKKQLPEFFETSFLNIFPFKSKSYIIAGFHLDYPCKWTKQKIEKWEKVKNKVILKELSDLIVLRLEFWAMSPDLFNKIQKNTLNKYKEIFMENVYSHNEKLKTKINLFHDLKKYA